MVAAVLRRKVARSNHLKTTRMQGQAIEFSQRSGKYPPTKKKYTYTMVILTIQTTLTLLNKIVKGTYTKNLISHTNNTRTRTC